METLDHSNLAMTKRYLDIQQDDVNELYDQLNIEQLPLLVIKFAPGDSYCLTTPMDRNYKIFNKVVHDLKNFIISYKEN